MIGMSQGTTFDPAAAEVAQALGVAYQGKEQAAFLAILDRQTGEGLRNGAQDRPGAGKNGRPEDRDPATKQNAVAVPKVMAEATNQAVAELASQGQAKPAVALATAEQTRNDPAPATEQNEPGSSRSERSGRAGDRGATPRATPQDRADTDHSSPTPRTTAKETTLDASTQAQAAAGQAERSGQRGETAPAKPAASAQVGAVAPSAAGSGSGGGGAVKGDSGSAPMVKTAAPATAAARALGVAERAFPAQPSRGSSTVRPGSLVAQHDHEKFAAQLGKGMAAVLRQGGGSVTLRLQPEALGQLKVKLDLEPGKVAATFEVGTKQARELLNESMSTLRSALEARGLDVDRLEVRVVDRSSHGPGDQDDQGPTGFAGGAGDDKAGSGGDRGEEGRTGSEHPRDGDMKMAVGQAGTPTGPPDAAEPAALGWGRDDVSDDAGGARVRIRLDAVA